MAKHIQLVHATFMHPFFHALKKTGVLNCTQLRQSGAHHFRLFDPTSVLPRPLIDEIVMKAVHSQGREILAEAAKNYRMAALPGYGDMIMGSPDVLSAMLASARPEARLLSGNRISSRIENREVIHSISFANPACEELNWTDIFALALSLAAFKIPFGDSWVPKRIDVPMENISLLEEILDGGNIDIRTSQPVLRLHFDAVLLGRRLPSNGNIFPSETFLPISNSRSIFQILDSLTPDSRPSIAMIASYLNMSSRTLERLLAAEGTTFQQLLATWRIGLAFKLLRDPELLVRDISSRLHYSSTSHFDRAFRGWTGTTPGTFREE